MTQTPDDMGAEQARRGSAQRAMRQAMRRRALDAQYEYDEPMDPWVTGPLPGLGIDQWPTMTLPPLDVARRSTEKLPPLDVGRRPTEKLPPLDVARRPTTRLAPPDVARWPTMRLPAVTVARRPGEEPARDAGQWGAGAAWGTAGGDANDWAAPLIYGPTPDDDLYIDDMPTWVAPVVRAQANDTGSSTASHRVALAGAEGYLTLVRNLAKSSGVYAVAALGAPLISLALTPLLTRYLSPTDYGILTVANTLVGLGAGISQLGLGSAFFRAYTTDFTSERDRRAVLATITILLLLLGAPLIVGAFVAGPTLAALLFRRPGLGALIPLVAGIILAQNLAVPGFSWLRAENRAAAFSSLSIANLVIGLCCSLTLVCVLHKGIAGALIGTGSGYAAVALLMTPTIAIRSRLRLRVDIARSMLAFGAPLTLGFVSYWILQLSDRYLLSIFGSLAQTASYAVAYSLGSVLSTAIIAPFSLAWPTAMYTIARRKDAPRIFSIVFRWFSFLLLFAAFGLALGATLLLRALFPPSYAVAAPVIPIVALSIAFFGVYTVLMTGANVRRKTWMTAVFTTIAAAVNLAFNLALIPRYGAIGAAASTLLAYMVLVGVTFVANQRIYPIPYDIGRFFWGCVSGGALYLGAAQLGHAVGPQWAWPINITGLFLYGALLALLATGGVPLRLSAPLAGAAPVATALASPQRADASSRA